MPQWSPSRSDRPTRCALGVLALLVAGAAPSTAQVAAQAAPSADTPSVRFEDVSAAAGIGGYRWPAALSFAAGISAADYDGDGWIDVFVPTGFDQPDRLYHNRGDGTFDEMAGSAGLASLANHKAGLWFDCDGDRDLDLLVAGDCFVLDCTDVRPLTLYEQTAEGEFTDVTEAAGLVGLVELDTQDHFGGMAAGDVDNDGDLDIYVSIWGGRSGLLRNEGDGTFVNVAEAAGAEIAGHGWQPLMHDFDGDGRLDIFVCVDFAPNVLLLNRGDGTFTDVAPGAGLDNAMNDMGVTLGDYDGDRDLDVYVTNIADDDFYNVLLRNDSTPAALRYTEVSGPLGVRGEGWGWGTVFFDADNDAWIDLAYTNGFGSLPLLFDESRLWRNPGAAPGAFEDISAPAGFNDIHWGSGLVAFDRDRDGDLELMQACQNEGPLRLLDNTRPDGGRGHRWLVVQPRDSIGNHFAIGALVELTVGRRTQVRLITAGTSLLSQEPAEAHFGVGTALRVSRVRVAWPGGGETVVENVVTDQLLVIER